MKRQTLLEYSKVIAVSLSICGITALFSIAQFYIENTDSVANQISREEERVVVVIDPGHGGEDGGAVGTHGSLEKDLNLAIAAELADMLSMTDIENTLTRSTDTLLYKEGQENRKKFFDLKNRVDIAKQYDNPIFVSIHQNKFPLEKYHGLQVYYSANNSESSSIAEAVQSNCLQYLQKDNTRKIKEAGRNIYVLRNLDCPAVLVECGFLSNSNEEQMLCDKEYQRKLAFIIFKSIVEYTAK